MKPSGESWALRYEDPSVNDRILIPLPSDMHRDIRLLAKARGVTLSELIRQVLTAEVAKEIAKQPNVQRSFRGVALGEGRSGEI